MLFKNNPRLELLRSFKNFKLFEKGNIKQFDFLLWVATKAGQSILDQISDATNTRPKIFNITNEKLVSFIKTICYSSADIQDKVVLIYEYVRQVTAKYNGGVFGSWVSVCKNDLCLAKQNDKIYLQDSIQTKILPPLRKGCVCFLSYDLDITNLGLHRLYNVSEGVPLSFDFLDHLYINPEAVWAGGNGLVGKDKRCGYYYNNIKIDINSFLSSSGGLLGFDAKVAKLLSLKTSDEAVSYLINTFGKSKSIITLVSARLFLSDLGFLQLLSKLGYKGYINTFMGRALPKYKISKISRSTKEKVQKIAIDLADSNGRIDLHKYGFVLGDLTGAGAIKEVNLNLNLDDIRMSVRFLELRRVLSILDNFSESQYRAGGGIAVIRKNTGFCVIPGEGNHRVFSAILLGLKKIKAIKTC